jgi:hypothetical protein
MKMIKHKFKSVICERDGIKFRSKLERAYFDQLQLKVKAGIVLFFLRQVGFDIAGARHFVDYCLFNQDGSVEFVEVKGRDLPAGRKARLQVESLYPIKILLVTKV